MAWPPSSASRLNRRTSESPRGSLLCPRQHVATLTKVNDEAARCHRRALSATLRLPFRPPWCVLAVGGVETMAWSRVYALRSYLRSSLWVVPVFAYVVSIAAIRLLSAVDVWIGWDWEWRLEIATVQITLQGLIGATISFIVFAFSSLLV